MSTRKAIVLDANILIRGVFGRKVRQILNAFEDRTTFYAPDVCFRDAEKYTSQLSRRHGIDPSVPMAVLEGFVRLVHPVHSSFYADYKKAAIRRVRDPEDWPIVAVAMLLGIPIWTEDQDFFGSGIAIWTTDRVELFLSDP